MPAKVPGWLKVFGVVCAILVLLGVGVTAGSFFLLRSSVRQFEAADRSFDAVAERYGGITDYRPEADGGIRAERLDAFLSARELVGSRRERVEKALTLLSGDGTGGDRPTLSTIRGTVGLLRNVAPFHRQRNEVLMELGVGLGEYYYMYTLIYYSWLGKSPADGPPFKIVGENGYVLETIESLDEPSVRRYREEQARGSLNRLLLPVLRNQLADLAPDGDGDDLHAYRQALASEIAALEADAQRLPWEDGLPEIIERSLQPYRDTLNDSYCPMCNAIEIGLARRAPDPAPETTEVPS